MQRRSGKHRTPLWKRAPAPGISGVAMLSKPTRVTLGLIEAFQKRDNSRRNECMSVPLLPGQRKGDNPFIFLREQLKGIIRTGIADIATLNQHRILSERQRSKPCNNNNSNNKITYLFPRTRAHPAIHRTQPPERDNGSAATSP